MRQKLFTKEIDNKLFSQYKYGNDLSKQMVVAKIYNSYGNGIWYLLNSDPNDPDYLWAIVDLYDVEVGSVSRQDLETIKVPPFGLNLERDMYFQPVNAKELYDRVRQGERFAKGGIVITSIKDIPNLEQKIKNREVTYRGLGMGKLADDFYKLKGESGVRIKVDGKEYFITQNEFDTIARDSDGKMRIRFDAPQRKGYAEGGELKIVQSEGGESYLATADSKPSEMAVKLEHGGRSTNKQEWVAIFQKNKGMGNERKVIQCYGNSKEEAIRDAMISRPHYGITNDWDLVEIYTYSGNLPMMANGGGVAEGNLEMVKNQAIQIDHHAKELKDALKSNPRVDGWVVSLTDRATSNLSDVTHYLEGQNNKFANGGKTDREDLQGLVGLTYQLELEGKGGSSEHKIVEVRVTPPYFTHRDLTIITKGGGQDVIPFSKLDEFLNNDTIILKDSQGESYAITLIDLFEPKVVRTQFEEEEFEYAKGGLTEHGLMIGDTIIDKSSTNPNSIQVMNNGHYALVNLDKGDRIEGIYKKGGKLIGDQKKLDLNKNGRLDSEDFKMLRGEKMADGGEIRRFDRHEQMDSETRGEIIDTLNEFYLIDGFENIRNYLYGLFDGYDYSQTDSFKDSMSKLKAKHPSLHNRIEKIYDKIDTYSFTKMSDGGYMAKGGIVKLESVGSAIDTKTKLVYPILKSGKVDLEDDGVYLSEVTDEWMDSLSKKDKDVVNSIKKYADGGYMAKGGGVAKYKVGDMVYTYQNPDEKRNITYTRETESGTKYKISLRDKDGYSYSGNFIDEKSISKTSRKSDALKVKSGKMSVEDFSEKWGSEMYLKQYAKGGKTKFNDKVKSIAKKLLENKKVPKKVQKDYGKTFNKEEAIDSAKRIAGAMRKKEMAKKKR